MKTYPKLSELSKVKADNFIKRVPGNMYEDAISILRLERGDMSIKDAFVLCGMTEHQAKGNAARVASFELWSDTQEKKCTKCLTDKPLDGFDKSKAGKFGRNSACKECRKRARKEYSQTPAAKEAHRKEVAAWRKANPEKQKEISRRCWEKNKERYNKERREKYANDPEYRAKKLLTDKLYNKSGRRRELYIDNREVEIERTRRWRERNLEFARESYRVYRAKNRELLIKKEQKERDELADNYVIKVLKKQMKHTIDTESIPKELIDSKRQILKLKRLVKSKKND